MKSIQAALLLANVFPFAASAQSFPPGFFANGSTGIDYYQPSDSGDATTLAYIDATFGYDGAAAGSAFPFGFQADVLALRDLEGGSLETDSFYPWIFYDAGFGRISLGRTRPLAQDYLSAPRYLSGYALNRFFYTGLLGSPLTAVRISDEVDLLSLRFDGSSGAFRYGVAYSDVENSADDAVSAALGYALGNTEFGLVYENVSEGANSVDFYGASVVSTLGNARLGARYNSGSIVDDDSSAFNLSLDYALTDQIDLGGAYTSFSDGATTNDLTHVYAAYEVLPGFTGEFGYAFTDSDDIIVGAVRYGFDF